jgi:chaperonin GroEL (HSP60 family)
MTIDCGFLDPTLINDSVRNTCDIKNPMIFAFKDPIDTAEMGMFLDMILAQNIIGPIRNKEMPNPVVILAPRLSRDYSAYIDNLMESFAHTNAANRGLLNIITNIQGCDMEQFEDICDLCGCKYIKKYLDPEIQKNDIEKGLAPTEDNLCSFAGTAELVSSDAHKTTFVNPAKMYNKDGSPSELFNQRTDYLQKQIDKLTVEGNNTVEIYTLKKRLNSLKGKMVEIYIGGVTVADRDAERDLLEDAVLNCRSAALNGVGFAANFEGLRAASEVFESVDDNDFVQKNLARIIFDAYGEISRILYESIYSFDKAVSTVGDSLKYQMPFNIESKKFDYDLVTSIDTDICTIDTISKIITIMATANQFIMSKINVNNY